MTGSIDDVTALQRAYDDLARVVSNLGVDELTMPTCCPEWDVRGLLNHTLGAAVMFTLANAGQAAGEDAGDLVGDDPVGATVETSVANLAAWRDRGALEGERIYPWGTFPARIGLLINMGEVALHSWDLAIATGQDASIDPHVAHAVFDLYRQIPMDDMRVRGVYGAEISVPASAPLQERLLGLLGRQV
jgi:uncharacterized protein (TIGR03086 family)